MDGQARLDPEVTTIVVVDVQNDFCHPDGACAVMGNDVTAAVEMVGRLEELLAGARAAGVPITWIQTEHDETNSSEVWLSRRSTAPASGVVAEVCRTGSWGADFYRVAPLPGEAVVKKSRYSAFARTTLDDVLRASGRQAVILTGVSTNVCVESTLREALFHEYHVTLVEDCCASYEPELHEGTVANVRKYFGYVRTSAEVLAHWQPAAVPVG